MTRRRHVDALFVAFAATAPASRKVDAPARREAILEVAGAALRLLRDRTESIVRLEVTHGPVDADATGWLDLWNARLDRDLVPSHEAATFADALAHGIVLLDPNTSDRSDIR